MARAPRPERHVAFADPCSLRPADGLPASLVDEDGRFLKQLQVRARGRGARLLAAWHTVFYCMRCSVEASDAGRLVQPAVS